MDLLLEVVDVLPTGGQYLSDWIDSAEVLAIRAAWSTGGTVTIEESIDGSTVFQTTFSSTSAGLPRTDAQLTSRFFRVHINGPVGQAFAVVVRAVA